MLIVQQRCLVCTHEQSKVKWVIKDWDHESDQECSGSESDDYDDEYDDGTLTNPYETVSRNYDGFFFSNRF